VCNGQNPLPQTAAEAIAVQKRFAPRIETVDRFDKIETIAGIDVAFPCGGKVTRAAIQALSYPALEPIETAVIEQETRFPYIPGLLSFREAPSVLAALAELKARPDLLMIDGHGLAHPRRFGIACHVGLLADIPAVGVAKSRLTGRHDDPKLRKGSRTALVGGEEVIGTVLRTRNGVKPVYVSVGHRVSLETAVELTLACATRYRLPEPTRLADKLSKTG
jgi:deoxyribonuclease V